MASMRVSASILSSQAAAVAGMPVIARAGSAVPKFVVPAKTSPKGEGFEERPSGNPLSFEQGHGVPACAGTTSDLPKLASASSVLVRLDP